MTRSFVYEGGLEKCLPSPCNYYCSNTICKLLSWCYNCLTSSNHAGVIYNSTRAAEVPLLLPTHWNPKWAHCSPSLCVTLSVCRSDILSVMSVSVTLSLSQTTAGTPTYITCIHYCCARKSSLAATLLNKIFTSKWKFSNGISVTPNGMRGWASQHRKKRKEKKNPVWSTS